MAGWICRNAGAWKKQSLLRRRRRPDLMDTPQEERFSDLRLKQAKDVDAQVLATACPYCITNFEESRLNLEYENLLEVKDITEIVSEML